MPTTNDLNERIARAKGWTYYEWYEDPGVPGSQRDTPPHVHWRDPAFQLAELPNWVGTLEGVAELLTELSDKDKTAWCLLPDGPLWRCCEWYADYWDSRFASVRNRPGECVAKAWLNANEKKEQTDDDSA